MNCQLLSATHSLLANVATLPSNAAGQPAPSWTDKEVLVAVGSVIGTLLTVGVPLVLFLLRQAGSHARKRVRQVEAECFRLRGEINQFQKDLLDATQGNSADRKTLDEMELRLQQAQEEAAKLLAFKAEAEDQAASLHQLATNLKADLANVQTSLTSHQEELKAERRRIEKALQKDGQTWTEKVRVNVPDFEPLQPGRRTTPIISVLNLKGGVGKTTITANLGAALDSRGYRVLLLDLDLQGSLTNLFLPERRLTELFQDELLIGDFLAASFDAAYPKLTDDYIQPVLQGGKSGLVATTDQLAYAEMNLTIRWLLREGKDPRFLLRRELHLKRITNRFDIVLLDCPPLINVCCVNALAASDYVLIPILPSKQATDRAPILLQRLKDFRDDKINTELKVLGIVVNRTQRSELTLDEQNRLTALRATCKDIWGQDVPLLDTFIRQNAELRAAEDEHRPLHKDSVMYGSFLELAKEVESRLPSFCHPAETEAEVKETVS